LTNTPAGATVSPNVADAINVLCLSSAVKGHRLLRALKARGCRVFLLTEERWRGEDWPYDVLDGIHYMHSLANRQHVINAASYMARGVRFDLIIPLDEYEVQTAGALREHFVMPGLTSCQAQPLNDKLAMRVRARAAGLPTPDFTPIFNYDALREWMDRVPPPWLLKPRQEAGAMGIKRCDDAEQVWRWLDRLGDNQSRYLLEQFLPSQVFHVDALVWEGQMIFAVASAYGAPPLAVMHEGGVFVSRTLPAQSEEARALFALNAQVIAALAPPDFCGALHAEYLRGLADSAWRFLEIGARVGGAHIADAIEFAAGVNLWEAWAHIELARYAGQTYALPPLREDYAGIVICLARQAQPDLSAYDAPEVVWRLHKPFHAGLIVVSPDAARVQALLDDYAARFARDFLARAEPLETGRAI